MHDLIPGEMVVIYANTLAKRHLSEEEHWTLHDQYALVLTKSYRWHEHDDVGPVPGFDDWYLVLFSNDQRLYYASSIMMSRLSNVRSRAFRRLQG